MKLEELTKDELIHLVRVFQNHSFRLLNIEYEVLQYRANKYFWQSSDYAHKAISALENQINLLKPYEQKPFVDVPESVLGKAQQAQKEYFAYTKKEKRAYAEYQKINKQLEKYTEAINDAEV